MPLPLAIGLGLTGLSLLPEINKLGIAGKYKRQADELAKVKQPKYEIPDAQKEATTRARMLALETRLPGQSLMEQKIGAGTAAGQHYATETASSGVDALATANAMTANQQNALGDLAIGAAENYYANQQKLNQQLGVYSQFEDKKWDLNQYQPYLAAKQRESELRHAGDVNTQSAIEGGTSALGYGLLYADKAGLFNGGGTKSIPPVSTTIPPSATPPFNPSSTTPPYNYPFPNAFPTAEPSSTQPIQGDIQRQIQIKRMSLPQYRNLSDEQILALIQNGG